MVISQSKTAILILVALILSFFSGFAVASYEPVIKYQDYDARNTISFYPTDEYPDVDGKFVITQFGDTASGKYVKYPNAYGLRYDSGAVYTVMYTDYGIHTVDGYVWKKVQK
jgi:hypothetical protein